MTDDYDTKKNYENMIYYLRKIINNMNLLNDKLNKGRSYISSDVNVNGEGIYLDDINNIISNIDNINESLKNNILPIAIRDYNSL